MFTRWEQLSSQRQFCLITYKTRWGMDKNARSSGSRAWLGYGMFTRLHGKPKAVGTPERDFCAHSLIIYSTLGWMASSGVCCEGLGFWHVPPFSAQRGCAEPLPVCLGLVQYSWVKNSLCNCADNQIWKLWGNHQTKNKKAWRISLN